MRRQSLLRFGPIAGLNVVGVAGGANTAGRILLQKPVDGAPCPQIAEPAGVSFLRPGRGINVASGRTLIRTRSGDPGAGCSRIGRSYNCQLTGPTVVEVRNDSDAVWFDVPDGARAVLAGDTGTTACTLLQPGETA